MTTSPSKASGPRSETLDVADDCPICLQLCSNASFVPVCSHRYCFECIRTWTLQSRECPLCKQSIGGFIFRGASKFFLPRAPGLLPLRTMSRPRVPPRRREWGSISDILSESARVDIAVKRRRIIYERDLYAKTVVSPISKPYPTPSQFSELPELVARTTAFIKRELRVWPHIDVDWLSEFIISFMESIEIRSKPAVDCLAEFLDLDGERRYTLHFVHEVYTFVCSPFQNLFMYDAAVQYDGLAKHQGQVRNSGAPYRSTGGGDSYRRHRKPQ